MYLLFVNNANYVWGRRHTMSAFHVISDTSFIIINVWNVITTFTKVD